MIPVLLLLAAWAQEHAATAPTAVKIDGVSVPQGPPTQARVTAGQDLVALVRSLPAGSILTLEPGVHRGPLLLDRPITVQGEAGAVLSGQGVGTVLTIAADDVTVRDLRVTGGGFLTQNDDAGVVVGGDRFQLIRVSVDDAYLGIDLRMADHGLVEGCAVRGDPDALFGERGDGMRLWESHHNVVRDNTLEHVRDLVIWYSEHNRIEANRVSGSRYGTHLMHASDNQIVGNEYRDDVVGVFVMYSNDITLHDNLVTGALGAAGVGLGFKESDGIVVTDNRLIANTTGIYLDTTPHNLNGQTTFRGNLIAANETALRFNGPQYGGLFEDNNFVANRAPVSVHGGGDAGQYRFHANQWDGWAGYDLDGDGLGDVPYEARSLSGDLTDRHPNLAFFSGTPAAALLDLFAEAFPLFRPDPVLVDDAPAMTWEPR